MGREPFAHTVFYRITVYILTCRRVTAVHKISEVTPPKSSYLQVVLLYRKRVARNVELGGVGEVVGEELFMEKKAKGEKKKRQKAVGKVMETFQ